MILLQIYSGNDLPYFIRITRVLWKIITRNILVFFSRHSVLSLSKNTAKSFRGGTFLTHPVYAMCCLIVWYYVVRLLCTNEWMDG